MKRPGKYAGLFRETKRRRKSCFVSVVSLATCFNSGPTPHVLISSSFVNLRHKLPSENISSRILRPEMYVSLRMMRSGWSPVVPSEQAKHWRTIYSSLASTVTLSWDYIFQRTRVSKWWCSRVVVYLSAWRKVMCSTAPTLDVFFFLVNKKVLSRVSTSENWRFFLINPESNTN